MRVQLQQREQPRPTTVYDGSFPLRTELQYARVLNSIGRNSVLDHLESLDRFFFVCSRLSLVAGQTNRRNGGGRSIDR